MKKLSIILLCMFAASCSTANTSVIKPIDVEKHQNCLLKMHHDSFNLRTNIENRIEKLGFTIVHPSSNKKPEVIAFVDYKIYREIVVQTFQHFNIRFNDALTNERFITSRYVPRLGVNDCDAALDIVFEDISIKMAR